MFSVTTAIPPVRWVFPGGFHFQYNTFLYHSSQPDRYPMCRKSDMITNLGATFMYMAITLACVLNGGEVSTGVVMGTIVFCGMELAVHTTLGTLAYFKYREKGKSTIYSPGSITAYLGFGVFGVILCYEMPGRAVTGHAWLICAALLATILVVWILIPENLIKKKHQFPSFPGRFSAKSSKVQSVVQKFTTFCRVKTATVFLRV